MLQIEIPLGPEKYDSKNEVFIPAPTQTLQLEHSLVSISKWESKWCKPFLTKQEKTIEETIDYIRCMTLTKNVKPEIYNLLTVANMEAINQYINAPMTATYISDDDSKGRSREQVTSELIYYWMIAMNIPIDECQKWHINRLLTLIRVCERKNSPPKKVNPKARAAQYKAINEQRRKLHNSKG